MNRLLLTALLAILAASAVATTAGCRMDQGSDAIHAGTSSERVVKPGGPSPGFRASTRGG